MPKKLDFERFKSTKSRPANTASESAHNSIGTLPYLMPASGYLKNEVRRIRQIRQHQLEKSRELREKSRELSPNLHVREAHLAQKAAERLISGYREYSRAIRVSSTHKRNGRLKNAAQD